MDIPIRHKKPTRRCTQRLPASRFLLSLRSLQEARHGQPWVSFDVDMPLSRPFFKRSLFGVCMLILAIFGASIATLSGETNSTASGIQIFYWYILPAFPFIVLLILAFFPRAIQLYMLVGAAFGAVVAVGTPYFLLWLSVANYTGGGANIGLGLLFLAMPVYLPLLMICGSALARLRNEFHLLSRKNES